MVDLSQFETVAELRGLIEEIEAEISRRHLIATADSQILQIAQQVTEAREAQTPEGEYVTWEQPTGPGTSYLEGRVVEHGGKLYRSRINFNVWEPGTADGSRWWEELVPEEGPIEWSAGVYYYSVDDAQGRKPNTVTYNGKTYECIGEHQGQPGWEPDNPALWSIWREKE